MGNRIHAKCDLSILGKGLSHSEESSFTIAALNTNLAAGKMVKGAEEGRFTTLSGDNAFRRKKVDSIKIDGDEGSPKIARDGPRLFPELDPVNIEAFKIRASVHLCKESQRF